MKKYSVIEYCFMVLLEVIFLTFIDHVLMSPIIYGLNEYEIRDKLMIIYWFWVYFPVWILAGLVINRFLFIRKVTLYRYKNYLYWYKSLYIQINILSAAYSFLLILISINLFCSQSPQIVISCILISFHNQMMLSLLLILSVKLLSVTTAIFITILVEFLQFILVSSGGVNSLYIPVTWSMYIRSTLNNPENGFDILTVCMMQLLVIWGIKFIAVCSLKKGKLLR